MYMYVDNRWAAYIEPVSGVVRGSSCSMCLPHVDMIRMKLCQLDCGWSSILKLPELVWDELSIPGNVIHQLECNAPHLARAEAAPRVTDVIIDGEIYPLWNINVSIDLHDEVSFGKRTEIKLGNPRPNASTRSSRPRYTICKSEYARNTRKQHARQLCMCQEV
jgi:hypothetical protein